MGNWYETCAISKLPIQTGDKVMVFPIIKRTHIYNEVHGGGAADKWYTPAELPFLATCKSEDFFEVDGDIEKTESIRNLQKGTEERMDVMFVLFDMYNSLIEEMINRDEQYNRVKKMAEMVNTEDFKEHGIYMPKTRFENFFWENAPTLRPILKKYANEKEEGLEVEMIRLFLFHHGIDVMRIPWHPGVGRGSQANEFFLWKKIAENILEREESERVKWLEGNILDEDESEDSITKTYLWYL